MVDTPVVVRTLADREDLILQRVGVVADDTELDLDKVAGARRGGHLVLLVWVCLLLNLKNGRSVLPFCGSSLLTEIGQNHHEEFQEVAALGGVRRANVLAELLYVLTVFVKLNIFHDFIHPLAEYGIVDVQMAVINKLVCEDLGKGLEFSQPLFWRRQRWKFRGHGGDGEMIEGGEKRVHVRFGLSCLVCSGGSSLSSSLTDPFLLLRQRAHDPDRSGCRSLCCQVRKSLRRRNLARQP